jgi:hypothetical protein
MEELLKKISSYNIFNYLLPGIVFVVLSKEALGHSLYVDNVLLGVFYYYSFGLIISRVGSVIIEPLLKKIGMVKHLAYSRFVRGDMIDCCGRNRKRTFLHGKVLSPNKTRREENVREQDYHRDSNRDNARDHGGAGNHRA